MTNTGGTPAGWYHAPGDPEGTQRYWDGAQWIGDPQAAAQSSPQPPSGQPPQYGSPADVQQSPSYGAAPGAGQPPAYGAPPGGQQPPAYGAGAPGGAPPQYGSAPPGYQAFGAPGAAAQTGGLGEGWQRIVARIIDGLIWFVIGLVFGLIGGGGAFAVSGTDGSYFLFAIASLAGVAAVVAYEVFMTTKTGNTLGKKVFNLKIVNIDGSAVDEKTMLMRMLTYIAAGVIGVIPILGIFSGLVNLIIVIVSLVFLFSDSMRQTVWDKIAKTKVIVDA